VASCEFCLLFPCDILFQAVYYFFKIYILLFFNYYFYFISVSDLNYNCRHPQRYGFQWGPREAFQGSPQIYESPFCSFKSASADE